MLSLQPLLQIIKLTLLGENHWVEHLVVLLDIIFEITNVTTEENGLSQSIGMINKLLKLH